MKKYIWILLGVAITGVCGFSENRNVLKNTSSFKLPKDSALKLVGEGYIYAYPIVQSYRSFLAASDPDSKAFRPANHFFYLDKLSVASNDNAQQKAALKKTTNRTGAGPNNDTPYFGTWINLSEGPLLLHIPAHGARYFSLQFIDFYGDNVNYISTRTKDITAATYLLTNSAWKGKLPQNISRQLRFSSNYVFIIGRTLVEDANDLPAVNVLQHAITIDPLQTSATEAKPYAGLVQKNLPTYYDSPDSFVVNLNNALRLSPAHDYDRPELKKLSAIGIGVNAGKSIFSNPEISADSVRAAIASADKRIENAIPLNFVDAGNHWSRTPVNYGRFGTDYLLKASNIRMGGFGGHSQEEAFYFFPKSDAQGDSLSGDRKYLIHFEKGSLPPVEKNGFWSLTAYEMPGFLLIPNSLNRYAIRDRTKGLTYNADGSLDIYIQTDSPGKDQESNWLPVSREEFTFCFRVYLPKEALLNGSYKLPLINRIN
jgi:hypothetical protein